MACTNTPQVANPTVEPTDTVASLRYEYYQGGKSEVHYYSHSNTSSHLYTRAYGSGTGWDYTVDATPVAPLTQLAQELGLDKYPFTSLDDENTHRDRWIVEVKYTNGKHVSIIAYLNDCDEAVTADVRAQAQAAFKAIPIKDENGEMMGEYSCTKYYKGKKTEVIYYTQEGQVKGGYDYDNPDATY